MARAAAGSRSRSIMASARARASSGGTRRPVSRSRMISGMPPTVVPTTAVPTASACAMTWGKASDRIDGNASTSRAAMTSGMSRRNPVKTTRFSRCMSLTRRLTSSNPTPSPTMRKRAVGHAASTRGAASRKKRWPLEPRMFATSPTTGPVRPNSARTALPETPAWNRVPSRPAGMAITRSAETPAATTTRFTCSPLVMTRSASR